MAGVRGVAATAPVVTGTSAKTILQLVAAANHRTKVAGWKVSFDGTSPTATPIKVELVRQTTAGTMSALTTVKKNEADDETLQTTAQHTATAEPTTTDVIDTQYIHPQGAWEKYYPLGEEEMVKGGNRLGIRVTAPVSVNAIAQFEFEE